MKLLLRAAGAAALLLVGGVIALVLFVGAAAESAIEQSAASALGVPARVGSVRMGLLAETFRMGDLAVANPPGFGDRSFLRLRRGRFELPLSALHRDPVPVRLLHLHGLDLSFERREERTNYEALLDHLQGRVSRERPPADGRRYLVRELVISGITVRVDAPEQVGEGGRLEVQVPELRPARFALQTAGGVSLEKLVEMVVRTVLVAVARHGTDLPVEVTRELRDALDLPRQRHPRPPALPPAPPSPAPLSPSPALEPETLGPAVEPEPAGPVGPSAVPEPMAPPAAIVPPDPEAGAAQ